MKKLISILCLISCVGSALAAPNITHYIPAGWKKIAQATGDLNKDGKADIALIIQNTDPKNIIKNDSLGGETLNFNPRHLLVLLNTGKSYQQVILNKNIPRENDEDASCLVDPLEDGELSITKGKLNIVLVYWMSCGGWSRTTETYQFRWQNQQFELIGFDSDEFHRATGDQTRQSFNFLTSKRKIITGLNEFSEVAVQPKVNWKNLSKKPLYQLKDFKFSELLQDKQITE